MPKTHEKAATLEALARATNDTVCMCDTDGCVLFLDSASLAAAGLVPATVIGQRLSDLGAPMAQAVTLEECRLLAMATGETMKGSVVTEAPGDRRHLEYAVTPIMEPGGDIAGVLVTQRDVTDHVAARRGLAEARDDMARRVRERMAELTAVNEELRLAQRALTAVNMARRSLVRATDEGQLIREVCDAAVDAGGYRMAWAGSVEHDDAKSIRPLAVSGHEDGYLDRIVVTWSADDPHGNGPVGRAVRAGEPRVVSDMRSDARFVWRDEAMRRGYRSMAALPLVDRRGIAFGVLAIYATEPEAFDNHELELLQGLAEDLSFGIESLRDRCHAEEIEHDLFESYAALNGMTHDVVEAMGRIVEARDPYTQGHERRVARLARLIAEEMGLTGEALTAIEMAALLHDIGKLRIPAEILTKPGILSTAEFNLIKEHPRQGYEILKDIDFPWPIADIVAQHHERLDGSGYPGALSGEEISMEARILSVADVVEAMASHRPYRSSLGIASALSELSERAGAYDEHVVAACNRLHVANRLPL